MVAEAPEEAPEVPVAPEGTWLLLGGVAVYLVAVAVWMITA